MYRVASCAKTQNLKLSYENFCQKMIWFHIYVIRLQKVIHTMNICAILKKLEEMWQHLIDSSKHSNQHDQSKIHKVNHCNFSDLQKIYIALVDCYNYQNWSSTSRSKYVPLKTMDEINYPRTIEVWEWPLNNFITHFIIHGGCNYLFMLGLEVILVDERGHRLLWVKYQHTWHTYCMYYVYDYLIYL